MRMTALVLVLFAVGLLVLGCGAGNAPSPKVAREIEALKGAPIVEVIKKHFEEDAEDANDGVTRTVLDGYSADKLIGPLLKVLEERNDNLKNKKTRGLLFRYYLGEEGFFERALRSKNLSVADGAADLLVETWESEAASWQRYSDPEFFPKVAVLCALDPWDGPAAERAKMIMGKVWACKDLKAKAPGYVRSLRHCPSNLAFANARLFFFLGEAAQEDFLDGLGDRWHWVDLMPSGAAAFPKGLRPILRAAVCHREPRIACSAVHALHQWAVDGFKEAEVELEALGKDPEISREAREAAQRLIRAR